MSSQNLVGRLDRRHQIYRYVIAHFFANRGEQRTRIRNAAYVHENYFEHLKQKCASRIPCAVNSDLILTGKDWKRRAFEPASWSSCPCCRWSGSHGSQSCISQTLDGVWNSYSMHAPTPDPHLTFWDEGFGRFCFEFAILSLIESHRERAMLSQLRQLGLNPTQPALLPHDYTPCGFLEHRWSCKSPLFRFHTPLHNEYTLARAAFFILPLLYSTPNFARFVLPTLIFDIYLSLLRSTLL